MRGRPDEVEMLHDSVEAYFAGGTRGGGPIYAGMLVLLLASLAALPLVHVDVTARARGLLRPAIERHRVAAGSAGIVEALHARRGQSVHAGDLLISLRAEEVARQIAAADSSAGELQRRAADLALLVEDAGRLAHGAPTAAVLRELGLTRYRDDLLRVRHEWRDLRVEAAGARAGAERIAALGRLGLEAPAAVEQAVLRRDRAAAAPALLAERQRATWAGELQQVLSELRRTDAERSELLARAALRQVRAPVGGTVEELSPLSPGSWVGAGEEVAVVSPRAPLIAEVYVDSRDAGRIRKGMIVRLLVDAFDHHEWGTLPARVVEIADDYTLVEGKPMFRVRCTPLRTMLRGPGPRSATPGKGMGITASFLLARRSILHLLWDRALGGSGAGT